MNTRDELGEAIGRVAIPMATALAEAFLQKLATSPRRHEFFSAVAQAALRILDAKTPAGASAAAPNEVNAAAAPTKVVAAPRCSSCRASGHRSNKCPSRVQKGIARRVQAAGLAREPDGESRL